MTPNMKNLQGFLDELNKRRDDYVSQGQKDVAILYRKGKGKPPRVFNDTSFLYIRSYPGDEGVRPFNGITFWNSPDIQISAVSTPEGFTTTLQAGTTYNIRCQLHNAGDVNIPYPKLEAFLCDPSLGFDTRFATNLGVVQYPGLLLGGTHRFVDIPYLVPPDQSGHKCLFLRTYSFSPLDKPGDVYDLNPRLDRHIGQKNLHIVSQGENYQFNIVHLPTMEERIDFVPLTRQAVAMLGLPTIATMKIRGQHPESVFRKARIVPVDRKSGLKFGWDRIGLKLSLSGGGPDIKTQASVTKRMEAAMLAINSGKMPRSSYREVLKAYQDMNRHAVQTRVALQIPDMGLAKEEVAGFEMINTNLVSGIVKGGITLLVRG